MFDVHETRYAARIDEFGPGGARPVVTGRRDIPTSKVLTRSGEYVDCEHNVERDFVTIVDLDPRVTRIRHQPHRLSYLWSGQRVSYVPDFELETVSGTYIVEVKTRREYERKEALRQRLSQIRQVYESIGLSFFISFDDHLGLVEYLSTEISTSKQKKFPLVTFVDTPGLVDGDMNYPFDVNEAILWLGNLVDLIFVFFDPIGQVK